MIGQCEMRNDASGKDAAPNLYFANRYFPFNVSIP